MILGSSKFDKSALQQLCPDEPWRWDPEWASGVINPNSMRTVMVNWFFAIFWNAVSSVVLIRFFDEWERGDPINPLLLIFPIVGLILLYFAVRKTLLWTKFGRSWLHLQTIPGVVGGIIKGQLVLSAAFVNSNDFIVHIKALQMRTQTEESNAQVLWQDRHEISPSVFSTTFMKTVPFEFKIPYHAPQSDEDKGVVWRLYVRSKDRLINYSADFDVPVFITKDSDPNFEVFERKIEDDSDELQSSPALLGGSLLTKIVSVFGTKK